MKHLYRSLHLNLTLPSAADIYASILEMTKNSMLLLNLRRLVKIAHKGWIGISPPDRVKKLSDALPQWERRSLEPAGSPSGRRIP
jgi:hypothetical protein